MIIRRRAAAAARSLTWIAAAWGVLVLVTGGFDTRVFGQPFTAHDPFKPLLAAAVGLTVYFLCGGDQAVARDARIGGRWSYVLWRRAVAIGVRVTAGPIDFVVAALLAAALLVAGVVYGAKAAGGSDSYGYLSQAALWREGQMSVAEPWVAELPWPNPMYTAAPLGYRAAADHWIVTPPLPHRERDPWALVPIYAPGLPLLMAAAMFVGGPWGAFWVVPLCAAVLVGATFGIGRRVGSRGAGLIAAGLVASSPSVVQMTMSVLSDVPVAAAWALAFWCALGTSVASAAGAGIAGAVAILTRPNLVPLALLLLVPGFVRLGRDWRGDAGRRERTRAIVCAAGLAAGALATSAVYWVLHGSPFLSGYGGLEAFHLANVSTNARLYLRWFSDMHTPLAFAGVAALAVPARWLWPRVPSRAWIVVFALFVAGLWLEYFFYGVFDSDLYLRFLLSSWPFIMLGVGAALIAATRFGSSDVRAVTAIAVTAVVVTVGWRLVDQSWRRGMFTLRLGESKFVTAAKHVRQVTPENSVVFAMQYSGSVRYYAGRMTMRWDMLDAGWLDRGLAWLSERGAHPYAMLENWERDLCVQRFAGESAVERFRRAPIFSYQDVGLYDLAAEAPRTPTVIIPDEAVELGVVAPAQLPTLLFKVPAGPGGSTRRTP